MDEPLGALDKKLCEQMQLEISRLHKKLGFTVDTGVIKKEHRTQENSSMIITEDEKRLYNYLKKLEKKSLA